MWVRLPWPEHSLGCWSVRWLLGRLCVTEISLSTTLVRAFSEPSAGCGGWWVTNLGPKPWACLAPTWSPSALELQDAADGVSTIHSPLIDMPTLVSCIWESLCLWNLLTHKCQCDSNMCFRIWHAVLLHPPDPKYLSPLQGPKSSEKACYGFQHAVNSIWLLCFQF